LVVNVKKEEEVGRITLIHDNAFCRHTGQNMVCSSSATVAYLAICPDKVKSVQQRGTM